MSGGIKMQNINKKYIKKTILLMGIIITTFLTSCGAAAQQAQEPQEPVITQDDITPSATVEEVLEIDAGEGKNYAYLWEAEDIDAAMQEYDKVYYTPHIENASGEQKEWLESERERKKEQLQEELSFTPVISAQEAANVVAVFAQKAYGINAEEYTIKMSLGVGVTDMLTSQVNEEMLIWHVSVYNKETDSYYILLIDANTSYILDSSISLDFSVIDELQGEKIAECFNVTSTVDLGYVTGTWDENHESFESTINKKKEELRAEFEQSGFSQGVNIAQIEPVFTESTHPSGIDEEFLAFLIKLEDGREITFTNLPFTAPYTEYNYGGYPLKGYHISTQASITFS